MTHKLAIAFLITFSVACSSAHGSDLDPLDEQDKAASCDIEGEYTLEFGNAGKALGHPFSVFTIKDGTCIEEPAPIIGIQPCPSDEICEPPPQLRCEGPGCDRVFASESLCEQSIRQCQSTCPAPEVRSVCANVDAPPPGVVQPRFVWSGSECEFFDAIARIDGGDIDDCCEGSDCDQVFESKDACEAAYTGCIPK